MAATTSFRPARPFRLPPANLAEFETRRAELEKLALEKLSTAEERCAALQGFEIVLTANTGEEGKLYGSIGPREIADAVIRARYRPGEIRGHHG